MCGMALLLHIQPIIQRELQNAIEKSFPPSQQASRQASPRKDFDGKIDREDLKIFEGKIGEEFEDYCTDNAGNGHGGNENSKGNFGTKKSEKKNNEKILAVEELEPLRKGFEGECPRNQKIRGDGRGQVELRGQGMES